MKFWGMAARSLMFCLYEPGHSSAVMHWLSYHNGRSAGHIHPSTHLRVQFGVLLPQVLTHWAPQSVHTRPPSHSVNTRQAACKNSRWGVSWHGHTKAARQYFQNLQNFTVFFNSRPTNFCLIPRPRSHPRSEVYRMLIRPTGKNSRRRFAHFTPDYTGEMWFNSWFTFGDLTARSSDKGSRHLEYR